MEYGNGFFRLLTGGLGETGMERKTMRSLGLGRAGRLDRVRTTTRVGRGEEGVSVVSLVKIFPKLKDISSSRMGGSIECLSRGDPKH